MLRRLDECDSPHRRYRQQVIFSPSLFIQSSARSRQIFPTQRKRMIPDFDEQCYPQPKPIHNSLPTVFGEQNLVTILQSIQQQIADLDTSIAHLEKGRPKIKPYEGDHQLLYINQSVECLNNRLEKIFQLGPSTFENKKYRRIYACKFCLLKFSKACTLGGHISRTHKEQSLMQKSLTKKITKKRKLQI